SKDKSWCGENEDTLQESARETIDGTLTSTHAGVPLSVSHQADGDTYRVQASWGTPRPSDKLSIPDKTVYTVLSGPTCGVQWSRTLPFYLWGWPIIFVAPLDPTQVDALSGSLSGTLSPNEDPEHWTVSWSLPGLLALQ